MVEKIDLNEADATVLATLSGISEELAADIVEYRETIRPFTEIIELTAVPGISEQMVREIEAEVMVSDVVEPEIEGIVVNELVETAPEEDVSEEDVLEKNLEEEVDGENVPEEDAPEEIEPVVKTAVSPTIIEAAKSEPEPVRDEPIAPANSNFKGQAYTAVIGAFIGTFLTLAVLSLLNGSLRLNQSAQVRDLERQYAESVATMQAGQTAVRDDLDALTDQVAEMEIREEETAVLLETIQTNLADTTDKTDALETSTNERLVEVVANAADLEAMAMDLDDRLTAVAASAENFDTFLNGLRELLVAVQGPSPLLTPTMMLTTTTTLTPTVSVTPMLTATPVPSATAAPLPTRTPRPTATPLGEAAPTALPTVTPTE